MRSCNLLSNCYVTFELYFTEEQASFNSEFNISKELRHLAKHKRICSSALISKRKVNLFRTIKYRITHKFQILWCYKQRFDCTSFDTTKKLRLNGQRWLPYRNNSGLMMMIQPILQLFCYRQTVGRLRTSKIDFEHPQSMKYLYFLMVLATET